MQKAAQILQNKLFKELSAALEALPAAFVVYDANERIIICNSSYRQEYKPFEHFVKPGVSHTDLQWLKVKEGLDRNAIGRPEQFVADEQDRHRNGPELEEWQDDHGRSIRLMRARLPDGNVVGMRFDISDLRDAQRALEKQNERLEKARRSLFDLANRDELTGLPNRRAIGIQVRSLIDACKEKGHKLLVLQLDLDGFKQINDVEGHAAGDSVLVQAAERLQALLPEGGLLARIGGDEFQYALACDQSDAVALGNRVVAALKKPFQLHERTCQIGTSVGVAASCGAEIDFDDLAIQADLALYQAKENGRGQVTVFTRKMAKEHEKENLICDELSKGYFAKHFEIMMQPVVDASDRTTTSLEAVLQWKHPRLGVLKIDDIQPAVNKMQQGKAIDTAILDNVLKTINIWSERGIKVPSIILRISPQFLGDPHLMQTLKAANIPLDTVTFSAVAPRLQNSEDEKLSWNIDGIHDLGIGLQLEGVSAQTSLSDVLRFRPDRLAMDPAITHAIIEQEQALDTVRMAVAIADTIGAKTVAMNVETEEQAAMLTNCNCAYLQGALVASPFKPSVYDGSLLCKTA